jgi:hypothetical protein
MMLTSRFARAQVPSYWPLPPDEFSACLATFATSACVKIYFRSISVRMLTSLLARAYYYRAALGELGLSLTHTDSGNAMPPVDTGVCVTCSCSLTAIIIMLTTIFTRAG